ncbi:hypothetical protein FK498_03635 [Elioraea sp. Yellowstone]|jgi:hypothetical protein|uniref:hypothetical protein n=1 Tax=Elioraea sp. Yellowstone TaxID=2592070 RepID=UPI0011513F89|nr:hypothetical protein [Elioraea sp. Yellowstone]TQF82843.1 hypothetical protein FK498_03635 [Elioraea sp. Yellowstone]
MTQTRPRRTLAALGLAACLAAASAASPASAHDPRSAAGGPAALTAQLVEVREALSKYADPLVAIRDGYFSTLGCVLYPEGGMGVHFLNPALIGPTPDPFKPQILVYEPDRAGRLHLVAAEWFIPLATGIADRPTIFGRPFDGPMEGHEPLMPRELHHYDLHVWLWKDNPEGVFNAINPTVTCPGYAYRLMEAPPPIVAHR